MWIFHYTCASVCKLLRLISGNEKFKQSSKTDSRLPWQILISIVADSCNMQHWEHSPLPFPVLHPQQAVTSTRHPIRHLNRMSKSHWPHKWLKSRFCQEPPPLYSSHREIVERPTNCHQTITRLSGTHSQPWARPESPDIFLQSITGTLCYSLARYACTADHGWTSDVCHLAEWTVCIRIWGKKSCRDQLVSFTHAWNDCQTGVSGTHRAHHHYRWRWTQAGSAH